MAQSSVTSQPRTAGNAGQEVAYVNSGVSTTGSYADILTVDNRTFSSLLITLVETGAAQSFYYKILGSIKEGDSQPANSDVSYVTLASDVSVAASGKAWETATAPWRWIIIQVKNNSGAATVTARARGVV